MDPSRLKVGISGFKPTADGKTFLYTVDVVFGRLRWSLSKRFSEFAKLRSQLAEVDALSGLPTLPSKTLLGRPQDCDVIRQRQSELQSYLHSILARPDMRTSLSLVKFLEFETQTHVVVPSLAPRCVGQTSTSQFSVSALAIIPDEDLVITGQEDASSLSRLGRVWTVVEPEETGCLSIWKFCASKDDWERVAVKVKYNKVKALHFHAASRRVFVGLDNGTIEVYSVPQFDVIMGSSSSSLRGPRGSTASPSPFSPTKSDCFAKPATELKAHEGSVVSFQGGHHRLLSVGYDGSIRVVCLRKAKILTGGRLTKRLGESNLTSGFLDEEHDRAFLGTSVGQVLVYSVAGQPPEFLHSITPAAHSPVVSIARADSTLFVGHGELVSAYEFPVRGGEKRMPRLGNYSSPLTHGRSVFCVTPWRERKWLVVGHEDSICVWDLRTGVCVSVFQYSGGASGVRILGQSDDGDGEALSECDRLSENDSDSSSSDGLVMMGGGSGSLQIWKFGSREDFTIWPHARDKGGATPDPSTPASGHRRQKVNQNESDEVDERSDTPPPRRTAGGRGKWKSKQKEQDRHSDGMEDDDHYGAGQDDSTRDRGSRHNREDSRQWNAAYRHGDEGHDGGSSSISESESQSRRRGVGRTARSEVRRRRNLGEPPSEGVVSPFLKPYKEETREIRRSARGEGSRLGRPEPNVPEGDDRHTKPTDERRWKEQAHKSGDWDDEDRPRQQNGRTSRGNNNTQTTHSEWTLRHKPFVRSDSSSDSDYDRGDDLHEVLAAAKL